MLQRVKLCRYLKFFRIFFEIVNSVGTLCSETSEIVAKYSVLNGNEQLFETKYKLYLPTEDELRTEIETQKIIFKLQQERESANYDE